MIKSQPERDGTIFPLGTEFLCRGSGKEQNLYWRLCLAGHNKWFHLLILFSLLPVPCLADLGIQRLFLQDITKAWRNRQYFSLHI